MIADDISYSDDPVFSDGLLATAVNAVATSTSLPGHPAVYCSSAGNEGDNGYVNTYSNLTDKFVRGTGNHGNLNLAQVDPALTAGGWHNWNPNGGKEPATTVIVPGAPSAYNLFLQWDDAFDEAHGITTSFNFLVFDSAGNYHPELSGTSDAFSIEEAYQQTGNLVLGTSYQIAITRPRKRIRLLLLRRLRTSSASRPSWTGLEISRANTPMRSSECPNDVWSRGGERCN